MQPMQVVEAGNERFVTGGVGEKERDKLLSEVSQFDLLVSFARRSDGRFLSAVDVTVTRQGPNSTSTNLTTAGPFLFAKLPAGHYEVTATLPGWTTQTQEVDVDPYNRHRLYMTLAPL